MGERSHQRRLHRRERRAAKTSCCGLADTATCAHLAGAALGEPSGTTGAENLSAGAAPRWAMSPVAHPLSAFLGCDKADGRVAYRKQGY